MKDPRLSETDSIYVGGPPTDTKVTLCIYADEIDPPTLTKLIGCQPTSTLRKGEKSATHPRRPPASVGHWFLEGPTHLSFEDQVRYLLQNTVSQAEIWQTICQFHRVELRCAIFLRSWTEGFSFSPDLLEAMGKRQWTFSLSMYSAEGDEIIEAFLTKPDASPTS